MKCLPYGTNLYYSVYNYRALNMVTSHDHNIAGIPVTRYIASPDSLTRDPCYCPQGDQAGLKILVKELGLHPYWKQI